MPITSDTFSFLDTSSPRLRPSTPKPPLRYTLPTSIHAAVNLFPENRCVLPLAATRRVHRPPLHVDGPAARFQVDLLTAAFCHVLCLLDFVPA